MGGSGGLGVWVRIGVHAPAVTLPGSQFPLKACTVVLIGLYIMRRAVGGSLHSI